MAILHEADYKVGKGRSGRGLRVWLQGSKLRQAGLPAGSLYRAELDAEAGSIRLTPTRATRKKDGLFRVSKKRPNGNDATTLVPVIDVPLTLLRQAFPDGADRVHVVMETGAVTIRATPNDLAAKERISRLQRKLENGQPIQTGDLCAGGGVLTSALAEGLRRAGVPTHCAFFVDNEPAATNSAMRNMPVVEPDTRVITRSMDVIDPQTLPRVEMLSAGLPCKGASVQGKAKNQNQYAEEHDSCGHLFISFLSIVQATQPAVVVLENVPPYRQTLSMKMIERMLGIWGYHVQYGRVDGRTCGTLEERRRMVMVATTGDIPVALDNLPLEVERPANLGSILEDRPVEDFNWLPYDTPTQRAKRDRDAAKGNNFGNKPLVTPESTQTPCCGAAYGRNQATSARIAHPDRADRMRLYTLKEHARAKGIPDNAAAGCTAKAGHQILGNSVLWPGFVAVGRSIGRALTGALLRRPVQATLRPAANSPYPPNQLTLAV